MAGLDPAPEGQDYEFSPLGTNEIRLLYVEPNAENKELHYTLKHANLSSKPIYHCLSYTWAYPQWENLSPFRQTSKSNKTDANPIDEAGKRKNPIECDGKTIFITDNLKFALARLWNDMTSIDSNSQERIPIWIDSICIHQESREEKGSQVAKMDEIYRTAQKVIVWLGPEHEHYTSVAIDVLSRLSSVPKEKCTADIPDGLDHSEIYKALGIDRMERFEWSALGELLMRTWFSRIWVIQELFEAREVLVYCGRHVLLWQDIVNVSGLLRDTGLDRTLMDFLDQLTSLPDEEEDNDEEEEEDDDVDDDKDPEGRVDVITYVANTVNNQLLFESLRDQKESLELETLLSYARYFGATNHADYIYAIRGMWKPSMIHQSLLETIKPDYTAPIEDIFTAATYASIIEMGDLNILSLVEDHSLRVARARKERASCKKRLCFVCEKEKDSDKKGKMCSKRLPSWVPDWSISPIAEPICMNPRPEKGSERWTASKGLDNTPPELIGRQLRVNGICIASIAERAAREPTFVKDVDDTEIFAILELLSNLCEQHPSDSSELVDSFWRTIIKDTYRDEKAEEEARKAFTSFLAVRVSEMENEIQAQGKECRIDSCPSTVNASNSQTCQTNDSPLTNLENLLNKIEARDKTGTIPTYQGIRQIIEEEETNMDFTGVNEESKFFAESFRLAYVGRRFFVTERHEKGVLLGIGPESLRKGDEIWVIAGADVPMVLRRQAGGRWKLVGECYVHGVMLGEAVRGVGIDIDLI